MRRARRARGGNDVEIPSREQIIAHLRDVGVPMQADELATALKVEGDDEREAFNGASPPWSATAS